MQGDIIIEGRNSEVIDLDKTFQERKEVNGE